MPGKLVASIAPSNYPLSLTNKPPITNGDHDESLSSTDEDALQEKDNAHEEKPDVHKKQDGEGIDKSPFSQRHAKKSSGQPA